MMSRGKMMCRGDDGENGRRDAWVFFFGLRDVRKVSLLVAQAWGELKGV